MGGKLHDVHKLLKESAPLVSVVVPVFNGARFVVAALESLSRQTYKNIDIIVVNDDSTDETASLVSTYQEHEDRLRVVTMDQRGGVHRARIRGMEVAHGQFLCFLDADDVMAEIAIKRLVTTLVRDNADVAIGGIRFISCDGVPGEYRLRFPRNRLYETDILSNYCAWKFGTGSLWNKIYRREILTPFLQDFGELISINEDYLVNFGVFHQAKRVSVLSEALYFYRLHQSSVTADSDRAKSFVYMLRAYVVCLEVYGKLGSDVRKAIDALYRNQLQFQVYTVPEPRKLSVYAGHLAVTLERLVRVHPEGVYRLCHLFDANDDGQSAEPWKTKLRFFLRKVGLRR